MIEKGFKENSDTHTVQSINLPKETEFRMRLEFTDDLIRLKLEQGQAEIFGAEMTKYYWYTLPVCLSISVYTWRGCSIKLCFPKDKNIQSYPYSYAPDEENQNYFLANCFMSINSLKERALEELKIGSKVLILGSPFSGKSTICRTLLNYSIKLGWNTVFCDQDPINNEFGAYGTINAAVIDKYLPYDFRNTHKISYFCGYSRIENHFKHYFEAVYELLQSVNIRLDKERDTYIHENSQDKYDLLNEKTVLTNNKSLFASGLIINAPSCFSDQPASVIKPFIQAVNPDQVLVVDHDGLKNIIQNEFPNQNQNVVKITKSGGAVLVDDHMRKKKNELRFNHWFRDENYTREPIPYDQLNLFQISEFSGSSLNHSISSGVNGAYLKLMPFDPEINSISKMLIGVLHQEVDKFEKNGCTLEDVIKSPIQCQVYIDEYMAERVGPENKKKIANVLRPKLNPDLDLTRYIWLVGDLKFLNN